jgi:Flp pilus assembly pilin Flp
MDQEAEMARWLDDFRLEEEGQDLVEYALIITFIAIAFLAFTYNGAASVHGIWTKDNANLVWANTTATGG